MSSPPPAKPPRINFVRAFLASAAGTGLSRVLGAVRDVAMAGFLGAGSVSDAFWIAFTVPNMLRRFVADEGLTGALIPALTRADSEEGRETARLLASRILGALLLANALLIVLGMLAPEPLVLAQAWSWRDDPEQMALAVNITRWLLPFCLFVSMVSYFEALLNTKGHFFVPKVAPGLVSAGIVGGLLWFSDQVSHPVWAVVGGVLVGGVAQVVLHVPVMLKVWGPFGIRLAFTPRVRAVLVELGKVVAIGVFAQINLLVLRQIASWLPMGSVTHYWFATRVVDLAQGVVAVAIGSALLPNISGSVADADWPAFRRDLTRAFRLAAFLLLPVATGLATFGLPIVSALFRWGSYSWEDTQATAATLAMMVPFMLFIAAINIVKRAYFALEDRGTLLRVAAVGVALTGLLGWTLVRPLGIAGLGLALSLSTGLQLLAYVVLLARQVPGGLGLGELVMPVLRMAGACLSIAVVTWGALPLGEWAQGPLHPQNLAVLGLGIGASAITYTIASYALGVDEVAQVVGMVRRRLGR